MNRFNVIAGHLLALTVGLTVEMEFRFIGVFRIAELVLAAFLILMLPFGKIGQIYRLPFARSLFGFALLWLVGQGVSDLINDTSRLNMMKGHAMIGMILVGMAGYLVLMLDDPNRFFSYLSGLAIGNFVRSVFLGGLGESGVTEYWDRFIGGWASPAVILISLFLLNRRYPSPMIYWLFSVYGVTAILWNGRSTGLIFLVTGVGFWFGTRGYSESLIRVHRRQVFGAIVAVALTLLVIFQAYVFFGLRGDLGTKAQRQLKAAGNPHNPLAVLIAGRGGLQVAVVAISDAPIFGHGSKAYNRKYILPSMRKRAKERLKTIPVHSCVFSAWVFSGILGVPFFVAVAMVHWHLYREAINSSHRQYILLSAYLLAESGWHIFFSPLGYVRLSWPPLLAVNILLYNQIVQDRGTSLGDREQSFSVPDSDVGAQRFGASTSTFMAQGKVHRV